MIDEYLKARKAGEKEYKARLAKGEYPFLPALDDILPDNVTMPQKAIGIIEIPVNMIAGTKTRGRQNSFAPGFMPLMEPDTEFAAKWSNLYIAQMDEGFTSPVKVYEYLHRFYVQEGNKRVSVSRFLDMPAIAADVTRIIPSDEVLAGRPDYAEFTEFYSVCPVYELECARHGAYAEIAELLGRDLENAWPEEIVRSLQASFWRFRDIYIALRDKPAEMLPGDAYVEYLRVYARDALSAGSSKELEERLRRLKKEFSTARNEEKVALVESAEDAVRAGSGIISRTGTAIGKVLTDRQYSAKHPLRAAFIYDRQPEQSNWVYNHEAGRLRLERAYGGIVLTEKFVAENAGCAGGSAGADGHYIYSSFEDAVGAAVDWGADVIFSTSVRQMTDTLRAAIAYRDVIFLNCSINLAHQAVRTYYAKLYEAKFLAGVIAGIYSAADGSHRIGYCSDYPIYGTIASINAFAIGAAMTDPEVSIVLDWSGRQDNNWWWRMQEQGLHVISAIDSTHNTDGSNAYGLCYVEEAAPGEGTDLSGRWKVTNLAAPIWKWGKLYEIIIKTILEGNYHARSMDRKDQATNYWWGMISGVVDIELDDSLPPYTRQLVEILRRDIESGSMNPFDGELRSQTGLVRKADDEPLSSMDVITMNWLNENVIGEIPDPHALTAAARETVSVSGVRQLQK